MKPASHRMPLLIVCDREKCSGLREAVEEKGKTCDACNEDFKVRQ